jgi:hypothetical protein
MARRHITKALEQLGYKDPNPELQYMGMDRYTVYLGDRCIGIWDAVRETFVD